MSLSEKEVEHIANLARLKLTNLEKKQYSGQLSDILDFMEKMKEVDTSKVEETSQVTGLKNITREDEVIESGIDKELVKTAPESNGGYIKVPKILEK